MTTNRTDLEALAVRWMPIEHAPHPSHWLGSSTGRCLIGHWNPQLDEDGEPYGPGEWSWVQVATLSFDAWHVGTGGFKGLHGFASFPLCDNATHWARLPGLDSAA
jgi:hypothetical protein